MLFNSEISRRGFYEATGEYKLVIMHQSRKQDHPSFRSVIIMKFTVTTRISSHLLTQNLA